MFLPISDHSDSLGRCAMRVIRSLLSVGLIAAVTLLTTVALPQSAQAADTTPPGPVTALTATPTASTVQLTWTNPTATDLAGVMIRRATGKTAPSRTSGTLVANLTTPTATYTDSGLAAGTTYTYSLFAYDAVPNYATRTTKRITTATTADTTPPGPVTALTATPTASTVQLTWTNPTATDLAGVMIRRATGKTAPSRTSGTLVANLTTPTATYTDSGLAAGTTYTYSLFAYDAVPNYATRTTKRITTATTADTTPPGPVTALTATPTASTVQLTWTNPTATDLAGVMIRRATGKTAPSRTSGTLVANLTTPTATYTDSGLAAGTTYTYSLFAYDAVPNYATRTTKRITTATTADTTPPGPVTALTATPTASTVQLTWTNPTATDLAGVMIRRATGKTAPSRTSGTLVANLTTPTATYTDSGLAAGTTYTYSLFAYDAVPNYATRTTQVVATQSGSCIAAVLHVSGLISTDTTWDHACTLAYIVDGSLEVTSGATLTVAAGTIVKLGGRIAVDDGGTVDVEGTATDPAIFTSYFDDSAGGDTNGDGTATTPHPGDYWSTFDLYAGANLTVHHADIRYGSTAVIDHGVCLSGGTNPATLTITDSLLRSPLRLDCGGTDNTLTVQRNTFDTTDYFAASLNWDDPTGFVFAGPNANTFTGDAPARTVYIGNGIPTGKSWTWSSATGAVISGGLQVQGALTVAAGTIVKLGGRIAVDDGGTVDVEGTATDPAIFTSYFDDSAGGDTNGDGTATTPHPGDYWSTFDLYAGANLTVHHADIRYGSTAVIDHGVCLSGGTNPATLTITDSLLRSPLRLDCGGTDNTLTVQRNTFDTTDYFAASLNWDDPTGFVFAGPNANTFTGDAPARTVYIGNGIPTGKSWTWSSATGAVISGGLQVQGALTVAAGTIVKLGGRIAVDDGGTVDVEGTATDPAIFTSYFDDSAGGDTNGDGTATTPHPGDYWSTFDLYAGANLTVHHADIRYGSTAVIDHGVCLSGGTNPATLTITDSLLRSPLRLDCGGTDNTLTVQRNTFDTTDYFAASLNWDDPTGFVFAGPNANTFTGDAPARTVYIGNGIPTGKSWTWSSATGAVISGGLQVQGALTVAAGTIVKLGGRIAVDDGGTVDVEGTATNPAIFTSYFDDSAGGDTNGDGTATTPHPGDYWSTFDLYAGANLTVHHADIRYGSTAVIDHGVCLSGGTNPATLTITDSLLRSPLRLDCGGTDNTLTVQRNTFDTTDYFAASLNWDDPTGFVFAGPNANTFTGDAPARTVYIGNGIPTGKSWTWSSATGAVISGGLQVQGALTVAAGTIVKLGGRIAVDDGGTVDVEGTATNPAIFTSYFDDSAGGDTNGDGTATTPHPGDYWSALDVLAGGTLTGQHVTIQYAGVAIKFAGAPSFLNGTSLRHDTVGVEVTSGQFALRGTARNVGMAIQACDWGTSCLVDASYVDWGVAGPVSIGPDRIVCGAVIVDPWVGQTAEPANAFSVQNCGGPTSSPTPDLTVSEAATRYNQYIDGLTIDCGGGFADACQAIASAQACLSAAEQLAISQSPVPLTADDNAKRFASNLVENGSKLLQQSATALISDLGHVTGFLGKALGLTQTILSLAAAYNQCAP